MAKKPKKKSRKRKARQPEPILSIELQEKFAHFLSFVSPKHFSRSLRDATLEISKDCDVGVPNYYAELIDGLEMFFHVLDLAEDEGKHCSKNMYER